MILKRFMRGISLGVFVVFSLASTYAQEDSVKTLEEVEVIGELSPEIEGRLSRDVDVIDLTKVEFLPFFSLQSVLNTAVQLDIRQRGGNDVQSDISLRGSSFDQVQILLNGFDVTDPQTGHHSFNLPISLSQVNQVQALSGASTRAMGVNSYAGTINFVTGLADTNNVILEANAGDFGYFNFTASTNIVGKKIKNFFSVNRSSSSGYVKNTDFVRSSFFYNAELKTSKNTSLEWQVSAMDKAFGANNFYTPRFPNQFEQLRTGFAGVRFKTRGKISTATSVHYRGNADRFELFRGNEGAPSWYKNHNYHFSEVLQANSRAWFWTKAGKSTFAVNYREAKIKSNVLGTLISNPETSLFDGEGFYSKRAYRSYVNFSLEQSYTWDKLKIAGGLMYYHFLSNVGVAKSFFPGVDLNYQLSKKVQLYAGVNTGMRLPTFTDLYYAGPSNIGNPNLVPESQITYQGGGKYTNKGWEVKANVFTNKADNTIDWVRKNDSVKWQPINVTKVETVGFDVAVSVSPERANWEKMTWIKFASLKWAYNNKTTSSPDYQSHYVLDYLKNKVVFTFEHKLYKSFYMGYNVRYQQREGQFLYYDAVTLSTTPQDYQPFTLVDARLNWKNHNWLVYASLNNVFDIKYQDYGNVIQPGRWFRVGVRKTFGLKKG